MATKSKRIKDKLLMEAYTPVEADSDGYSDGVDFSAVVGNKRFHSFQIWREKDGGRPTYVYGLTLTQIEAIRSRADEELASENAELKEQLEAAQRAFSELEQRTTTKGVTLAQENAKLKEERQWYIQTLRPLLNKQTNNFTPRGNGSIRAIPIPMGGTPERRIKPKRR
jgi:hypothetical protein